MKKKWHHHVKRAWKFFWHNDSGASWIANLVVAFIIIRYVVYPVLGIVLGTSFPIVAVISESMEHQLSPACEIQDNGMCLKYSKTEFGICGYELDEFHHSFDNYWETCGSWYEDNDISKEYFEEFPFKDGFFKGDVIVLWRANRENIKVGDILVFQGNKPQPIIHRTVKVWEEEGKHFYQTKGDHNARSIESILEETRINEERLLGKAAFRIPYLGWVKILFVDLLRPFGINIVS